MGATNLSVIGAPWTTQTAAIGSITLMGGVSPLSNTAIASGSVTLVTPVVVQTSIAAFATLPVFGVLTLHFVPEPGTLVLLAAGFSGCALIGRRRARSSKRE
jgi:hypothetical protein